MYFKIIQQMCKISYTDMKNIVDKVLMIEFYVWYSVVT